MNEFINENDVNYSFKNPRDAKQFMSSAERSGLKKQNMKVSNNKVSIKRVRDKEITNILNLLAKLACGTWYPIVVYSCVITACGCLLLGSVVSQSAACISYAL